MVIIHYYTLYTPYAKCTFVQGDAPQRLPGRMPSEAFPFLQSILERIFSLVANHVAAFYRLLNIFLTSSIFGVTNFMIYSRITM
jgi:hypothetical protein